MTLADVSLLGICIVLFLALSLIEAQEEPTTADASTELHPSDRMRSKVIGAFGERSRHPFDDQL